jgi:hypothetical protein
MIVDHDWEFGIKLADWLATHGYQAVLVRSVEAAIEEYPAVNPQAVFIGLDHAESPSLLILERLFRAIETTRFRIPVVTMGERPGGDLPNIPPDGVVRHLHFPSRPLEFTSIDRLLRTATAWPHSSSPVFRLPEEQAKESYAQTGTIPSEGASWIG